MINSLFGDRYKLGEMIGTGGMADVYVAIIVMPGSSEAPYLHCPRQCPC